ncbi:MAG: transglutaminase domain-containing protein [Candidatus Eisenbacteria bacterium]|nr:transglutaminase domain-containing protein [Candidatus Eisenbacteria bacterium]
MIPLRVRTLILLICFASALVSTGAVSDAAAAEDAEARDVWYEATLGGAPMGHVHETVSVDEDGLLVTLMISDYTMRRGHELVVIKGSDEWRETVEGDAVSFSQTRKMAVETQELDATVDPGRVRVRKSDGRDAVFTTVPFEGRLLFPNAIERLHAAKGFAAGSNYSYKTFDTDFEVVADYRVTVIGPDEIEVMGQARELNKLLLESAVYEGIEVYEWRDDDGRLWREEIPALGSVRQRAASDVASRESEAIDMLAASTIRSNVMIPSPRAVDEAVYELWLENGDITADIVEDGRQEVVGRTERGVLLKVRRVVPTPGTTIKFPVRSTPLKDYLDGNPMMQTWYPILLGTASKSVWESGQDTWQGAKQIEEWVYNTIEQKDLGTAFASAREVMERRSGDCTEHAVLMAAMTRAVGIPSKIAAGLVYHEGGFSYHMWVEVWTGEGWYALDPTMGEGSVDATHLKLAESAVPGGRIAELSLGIARLFNRLGLRVTEYTEGGSTVRAPAG